MPENPAKQLENKMLVLKDFEWIQVRPSIPEIGYYSFWEGPFEVCLDETHEIWTACLCNKRTEVLRESSFDTFDKALKQANVYYGFILLVLYQ